MPRALNITLSDDLAAFVDSKLASGAFPDASAMLSEGLRSLADEADDGLDSWLREEVAPAYDRVQSGSSRLLTGSEVFDGMEARYRARRSTPAK